MQLQKSTSNRNLLQNSISYTHWLVINIIRQVISESKVAFYNCPVACLVVYFEVLSKLSKQLTFNNLVREHLHSWQTVQHTAPVQLRQSFWPWAAANRNCLKPKGAGHGLSIIINVNTISWSLYNFSGLDTQQLQFVILGPGKPWIYSKPSFYQNLAIIAQLCAAPLLAYF